VAVETTRATPRNARRRTAPRARDAPAPCRAAATTTGTENAALARPYHYRGPVVSL